MVSVGPSIDRRDVDPNIAQPDPPSWGLDRIDSRTGLNNVYNFDATGEGVTIFIADGGVLSTHSEFQGRLLGCTDFTGQGCLSNDHATHVGKYIACCAFLGAVTINN